MSQGEWGATVEQKCRFVHSFYGEFFDCLSASTLGHHGQDATARLQWQMLRRHQRTFFLQGLKKLGLENEATDAIAAAKYHVLSYQLGGRDAGYVEETPEKVWVRYSAAAPGGSLVGACAPEVFIDGYRAWYAHNGRSLGNPRLGYVLTHLIAQGDPYDAGYFKIYDRDLDHPEETLQFSPGERVPPVDPAMAPKLPAGWTPERKLRALRNHAVELVHDVIRAQLDMFGVLGARALVEHAAGVTMTLQKSKLVEALALREFDAAGIATFIQRDRALLDEEVTIENVSRDEYVVRQKARNPRLFPDLSRIPVEIDEALLKGWRTLLELVNRDLRVDMTAALTAGDPHYEWVIRPRPP